jgi:predicted TIM-barrel fold metal-dependent hydrolase
MFQQVLDPISPQAHAAHRHPYIYDPDVNWRGGDIARRQVGGYDMARRSEDIRKEGIDKQVIFPTQITVATGNVGGLGYECARHFNDWVAKLVKGREDVFLPCAMAPAGCPEKMADELRRCVKAYGFRSSHLAPYCGSRNMDDPAYFPYYEAAEELGIPLMCHPNSNGELIDRFDNFYKTHVLGRPTNCSAALVALVLGGVFERFPKLKVVFFECSAEWPLYWMHRMDDDWEWAKDFPQISSSMKMAPSEYVKRNCWFTCEADEGDLTRPIAELGEDRILMASDYPHFDSEYPHTVETIRARMDLDETQKAKILGGNAAALLRL